MSEPDRLLVVDDELMNREMLSRRLQKNGFLVDVAEDAWAALAHLDRQPVDLILLDSMMPGMNGTELLQRLRREYSPERLPIIMVTALTGSERIVEALSLGANDYVTKPIDFPVALARIRAQLARKQAEAALRQSEERYALAARGANDGLWDWDLVSGHIHYSERWKAILGYSGSEMQADPGEWFSRIHPDELAEFRKNLEERWHGTADEAFESEHRMRHRNGSWRWVRCRGAVVRDPQGRPERMAGSLTDITEAKVLDPLTGLPNRLLFNDRLEAAFAAFQADPQVRFAVLYLDLDRFKLVNDSFGHQAGDELLRRVAERIRHAVRAGANGSHADQHDDLARLGGDEFALLLSGTRDTSEAAAVALRILQSVRQPFEVAGRSLFCGLSIGIALCSEHYSSAADIVRDADTAMYSAKTQGRSRYEIFDDAMRAKVVERLDLENDLRSAIEQGQIEVQYQPKVRLDTEQICGFEALARWRHPHRGLIMPKDFIPLAEETGLIVPLGLHVLRQACAQLCRWQQQYPFQRSLQMSVNVSARQFREPDLVDRVKEVLEETGLAPSSLHLEITESVLPEDPDKVLEIAQRLTELNVILEIDDFGTGYSSLSCLSRLPFNTLKLDRSFTVRLGTDDEHSMEIVKTIMAMAQSLHMSVIAEGVEQKCQVQELKSIGCGFAQGFYYARPMPPDEASVLLGTGAANIPLS